MGSEQCVAPHFFAAEAVEMDVELAGGGRGTASPLYWLIWTKSTSASTEEHRQSHIISCPDSSQEQSAHQGPISSSSEEHRDKCQVGTKLKSWRKGHLLQSAMCDSYHTAFRTAEVPVWSSSTGQHFLALLSNIWENKEPQPPSPFLCCHSMYTHPCPAVAHRHPQPLLALTCLS